MTEAVSAKPPEGALFCPLCQPDFLSEYDFIARDPTLHAPRDAGVASVFLDGKHQTGAFAAGDGWVARAWYAEYLGDSAIVPCPECGQYPYLEIVHGTVEVS